MGDFLLGGKNNDIFGVYIISKFPKIMPLNQNRSFEGWED